jgi:CubicO group peptidase (beta-lactamase class C family)
MRKSAWLLLLVALVIPTVGRGVPLAGQGAIAPSQGVGPLSKAFKTLVDAAGIVGASLLVVKDGQVLAHETVGYQDLDSKRPTAPATIYHWASITKTFTGIAIMQLRDRGLLTLDTPAVKYVPELRRVHNPFGDVSQVTIRTLMQHAAGFRASTWPWGGDKSWHPYEPTSWEQLAAMLPYTELLFEPGTQYRYSNPGIVFLGRIIEELSGDDFEVYVTKNILMPLGMYRTFFDRAPYHLLPDRSHSYFRTDGTLAEGRFDFDTGITVSNGGLNAPLTDMALYLQFLMGEPTRPVYDVVLKRSSLEEMWTPTLAATDGEGGSGDHVKIGLSFFVERYGDVELIGHSGDQNGFISHLYLHRPSHTAWVVNFNTEVTTKGAARSKTREVDDAVRDAVIAHLIHRAR